MITPEQAEKECTSQIIKWTNETERLRKFLKNQYDAKVETLPFPTLVRRLGRLGDGGESIDISRQRKSLVSQGSHLKFNDRCQKKCLIVLGAVTRDPEKL